MTSRCWPQWLASEANFRIAGPVEHQRTTLGRKHFAAYFSPHFKDVLQLCDRHGIDHRTPMNQTPLIAAAAAGNVALVEALLARGANPERTDHLGRNALHWALLEAFHDEKFARGPFAALYELIAPAAIDVMSGERLVRIDRHLSEYLLFQTLWALFKSRFTGYSVGRDAAASRRRPFSPPGNTCRRASCGRNATSVSTCPSLLSRNEVDRDYAYNRRLFVRVAHGWYQFNPALSVRRRNASGEAWLPICDALNRPLRRGVRGPAALGAHRRAARPGGTTADGPRPSAASGSRGN